jgi:hypothetical protein
MSGKAADENEVPVKRPKTREDKQAEHIQRIKRTLSASLIGILAGAVSYYIGVSYPSDYGLLALMIMLTGVVIQKHVFLLLGMDVHRLGAKDWLYQGFLTFAFWFMTWTILLTAMA